MEKHSIVKLQKYNINYRTNTDNCYVMDHNRKLKHIYSILKDISPLKFDCIDLIT